MTIKLLTEQHLQFLSLKEGCTGRSKSALVKMPHCFKSNVVAHIFCVSLIACVPGSYGQYCLETCGNCLNAEPCHHVDGFCQNGCAPGWIGYTCTERK